MPELNRRSFVQLASAASVASVFPRATQAMPSSASPIQLGVVVGVPNGQTPDATIARVRRLGFAGCQISFRNLTAGDAGPLKAALEKYHVQATAVMGARTGPEGLELLPGAAHHRSYSAGHARGPYCRSEAGGGCRPGMWNPCGSYPLRLYPGESQRSDVPASSGGGARSGRLRKTEGQDLPL